jgi:hypothetical protein
MHVGKARRLWRAFRLSTGKLVVRIRLGARHNVCGIFASARPINGRKWPYSKFRRGHAYAPGSAAVAGGLAAWCRRLAPMVQNIFEDLGRKPVARALRPAPTVA